MIVLKYLYYRVYKSLESRTEGASYGAFIYVITLLLVSAGVLQAFFEYSCVLSYSFLGDLFIFVSPLVLQLIGFVLILLYGYLAFARKQIEYFENLFTSRKWVNTHIKSWMIIGLPFVIFVVGIWLTTYVF